jgi:acetyl esterase/lipase
VGDHDRKDPVLSPMYADLNGFPPTLCMTSTRDHCLSGTVDFHRALLRAGVDARLMVFDACRMPFGTGSISRNRRRRSKRRRPFSTGIRDGAPGHGRTSSEISYGYLTRCAAATLEIAGRSAEDRSWAA